MESSFSLLPRSPLVDVNLLFDYLVWQFCVQADPPIEVPKLQKLSTPDLKDAFRWYLDLAKPIQTSPHVVAEIQGLRSQGWNGTAKGCRPFGGSLSGSLPDFACKKT